MRIYTLLSFLFFTPIAISQVGIGITNPTPGYALEIDGSLLVQKEFKVDALPSGTTPSTNFEFLLRLLNSDPVGEVTKLDLTALPVGPINVANYTFTNFSLDNVTEVDLQFDATKYVVGLSNVRYEGIPIQKGGSGYVDIGNFVSRTYIKNGKWHLEMRNRTKDAASSNAITYHVTLIVYDKKYFKELAPITVNFGGGNNATTTKPAGL